MDGKLCVHTQKKNEKKNEKENEKKTRKIAKREEHVTDLLIFWIAS